jgi:hypothetical protein
VSPWRRNLATLGLFSLLSVWWTWPLAAAPGSFYLSRQHDHYGMVWVAHIAEGLGLQLESVMLRWPLGKQMLLLDSFLWTLAARLTGAFMDPIVLLSLFTLLGPVLSAWAAERYAARGLGARWPYSLLAGACFGFGGIAISAILDGHIYFLLMPWLPLLALHWSRATGRDGRWQDGVLAGLWWVLCLLTSGYVAVDGTLLVLVLLAVGGRGLRWRPLASAAAVALPVGVAFLVFVAGGSAQRAEVEVRPDAAQKVMEAGSVDLASLVGWTPEADLVQNSLSPLLCMTALVVALLAPRFLPRERGWGGILVAGLVALLLAFGPTFLFAASDEGLGPAWMLRPLARAGLGDWFHFPARLLWVTNLALGAVAALVLSRMRTTLRWIPPALLTLGLLEIAVAGGMRQRLVLEPTAVPSVYARLPASGALLELVPDFHRQLAFSPFYFQVVMLHCTFQRVHDRPLLNDCISPAKVDRTQLLVSSRVQQRLLSGGSLATLGPALAGLGVGAVAYHPDLFPPSVRETLARRLQEALGQPLGSSRDAGEHVILWGVPPSDSPLDQGAYVAAYERLREGGL